MALCGVLPRLAQSLGLTEVNLLVGHSGQLLGMFLLVGALVPKGWPEETRPHTMFWLRTSFSGCFLFFLGATEPIVAFFASTVEGTATFRPSTQI